MNFRRLGLKKLRNLVLQILISRLFHSEIDQGKNFFWFISSLASKLGCFIYSSDVIYNKNVFWDDVDQILRESIIYNFA